MPATGTFTREDAVELAVVERSGFVESRHIGSAVVLAPDGSVRESLGSPDSPVFPRSSLKPFQAVAVMNAGVALRDEQARVATLALVPDLDMAGARGAAIAALAALQVPVRARTSL